MLTPDGVLAVRAHNHARQIEGTQFWAVMTIDLEEPAPFCPAQPNSGGCCRDLARTNEPGRRGDLAGMARSVIGGMEQQTQNG